MNLSKTKYAQFQYTNQFKNIANRNLSIVDFIDAKY